MNGNCFILVGLILNFIGALFMAFNIMFKFEEAYLKIGEKKHFFKAGIILLAIGFLLQIVGVILNSMGG